MQMHDCVFWCTYQTPLLKSQCLSHAHNGLTKLIEFTALWAFCHVISQLIICGAMVHYQLLFINMVLHLKKSDVHSSGSLAQAALSILFQQNGTLIVLADNVLN